MGSKIEGITIEINGTENKEVHISENELEEFARHLAGLVADKVKVFIEVLKCLEPAQLREILEMIESETKMNKQDFRY